jgi:vacuolar-type H+-ATPase subunit H
LRKLQFINLSLQCVQSADLQGAVDVARTAVKALQQRIADADIKAQSIVQNASLQASQVLGSTLTALQHMAQDVIEKIKLYVQTGRNIQTCITGQSEAARRVVTLAGTVTYYLPVTHSAFPFFAKTQS